MRELQLHALLPAGFRSSRKLLIFEIIRLYVEVVSARMGIAEFRFGPVGGGGLKYTFCSE